MKVLDWSEQIFILGRDELSENNALLTLHQNNTRAAFRSDLTLEYDSAVT